jgi:hypothetical protein
MTSCCLWLVTVCVRDSISELMRRKKLCTENPDCSVTLKFENTEAVTLRRLQPVDCVRAVLGDVELGCYLVRHIAVGDDGCTEDALKCYIGRAIKDDSKLAIASVILVPGGRALIVVTGITSRDHCNKS